ncbi:MAG: class I SAM-dependent methyltransferase [Thermodesulfobacteriota bacterium]
MTAKLAFGVEPSKRRYRLRLSRYEALAETVAGFIKNKTGRTIVLDVGVGSGRTLRYLEPTGLSECADFYGIDIDSKRLYNIYGKNKWRLVMADVTKGIPFKDESADIAIIEQVLEHISNPEETLKEMARVLKPGGLLIVGVPIFPAPVEWVRKKVTAYAAKRFDMHRGHVQTFTMKKTAGLVKKTGLFDISSVRGFRIASGGILGPLEDLRFWWRLNAFIGKIAPSLCTEIQVTARKRTQHGN